MRASGCSMRGPPMSGRRIWARGSDRMNIEKYTDRARGFIQSAQSLALARGPSAIRARASAEGPARRPGGSGRGPDRPLRRQFAPGAAAASRRRSARCRRSRAPAPARSISQPATARLFDNAEKIAEKAGDSFVTVERLLLALALEKDSDAGKILRKAGVTPQNLNAAIEALRKGRTADSHRPRTPMTR